MIVPQNILEGILKKSIPFLKLVSIFALTVPLLLPIRTAQGSFFAH
jgi:hypothetical protein